MGSRLKQVFDVSDFDNYGTVIEGVKVLISSGALTQMTIEVHGESAFEPVRQRKESANAPKPVKKARKARRTKAEMAASRAAVAEKVGDGK